MSIYPILAWFNRPVYCIFYYLKKKKKSRKSWIFNPGDKPKNYLHNIRLKSFLKRFGDITRNTKLFFRAIKRALNRVLFKMKLSMAMY